MLHIDRLFRLFALLSILFVGIEAKRVEEAAYSCFSILREHLDLQKNVNELTLELNASETSKATLQSANKELTDQLARLQSRNDELAGQLETSKARIQELIAQLASSEATEAVLQTKNEELALLACQEWCDGRSCGTC
jgi:chromosome segregation ATPase